MSSREQALRLMIETRFRGKMLDSDGPYVRNKFEFNVAAGAEPIIVSQSQFDHNWHCTCTLQSTCDHRNKIVPSLTKLFG